MKVHAPIYEIFDQQTVTSLVAGTLLGKQNRRLLIWSLLNVDAWMGANL